MFQNISDNSSFDNEEEISENKINLLLKELFKPHNCIIYILTFLVSMVEIKNEVLPFGLAIVGACLGSTIPIFMVYIFSMISVLIFYGGTGFFSYFCISLIFFLLIFIFKPKISTDDRNEVFKVGTRLFFASFIYYFVKSIKTALFTQNLFLGLIVSCFTYIFYKIFVNGIVVIKDFTKKEAYTVEEIIAAALILAIAISAFKEITILKYSITNILIILLVIYIGWKTGILPGATTGLSIGTCLSLVSSLETKQILIFTLNGIVAGMIGSIFKINRFKIKKEEEEILLENTGERRLSYYEEIKERINAVTQTITEMNNNFFIKNNEDAEALNKEVYIDNFLNLLEDYKENIFYGDLVTNEELIGDFFDSLIKEDLITEKEMLECFRKYNNYILLRDQKLKNDLQEIIKVANRTYRELQMNTVKLKMKTEESVRLQNQLKNVTKMINNIPKTESHFEKKEKEIITLLKGKMYPVKKVNVNRCKNGKYIIELNLEYKNDAIREKSKINNIEALISRSLGIKVTFQKDKKNLSTGDYIQIYSAEDKFALQVGNNRISKNGKGEVSGDSSLQIKLNDGKYLLAISDGMGSGEKARRASKFVINSLNTLLSKGFDQDETIELINSELNFNKDSEMYATVDISVLDLYQGNILISKNGACNTYIKSNRKVRVFRSKSLPVGIVEDAGLDCQEAELHEGDIILMCSDGLLESDDGTKEDWVEEFLKNVNTNNVQKIADLVTGEAIDYSFGAPKDDITVIVAKVIKQK